MKPYLTGSETHMHTPQSSSNIEALVSMLDEQDPELYHSISEAVLRLGEEAVPYLERARFLKTTPLWTSRVENMLRELRVEIGCRKLEYWKKEKEPDLMQGFYFLSSVFYPELSWEEVRDECNQLHGDCWLLLAGLDNLQKCIVLFNNFFFNHCKFNLNSRITSEFRFDDFFLPAVLQQRQGNERSLALVYQYLATRNKLPVFLLNLPVVNLLACTIDMEMKRKEDIRFCIDITHRGALIRREDLEPVLTNQIRIDISQTVEAMQDYVRLLYFLTMKKDKDSFHREAIRKIHLRIGNAHNSISPLPDIGNEGI